MEENDENVEKIYRKIEAGKQYTVKRVDYNGKAFYKIPVYQKNLDDTMVSADLPVRFKGDVVLENGTNIIIRKGCENFYFKSNDVKHYNPMFYILITEFDIVESPEVQNYADSINKVQDDDDLPW